MKQKIAVIGVRGVPATYGGIEKHCEELYSILVKSGYEVILYGRKYYNKSNQKEFKGIILKSVPMINVKGIETFIYAFIATLSATFSKVDIIHYHAQGPTIFCWIPKIFTPKKIVGFTCHGIDWQRDNWNFIAKTVIRLGELASATQTHFKIAVSSHICEYYKLKYHVGMDKIYNGVNIQPKLTLSTFKEKFALEEKEYLIFVSRLVAEKATEVIIEAFKKVNTNKKLVIVGENPNSSNYLSKLKDLGNDDDRIIFTGFLFDDNLRELYSNALAYISASRLEGLPISVLEALSYSLPVILSDIEPHLEILNLSESIGMQFKTDDVDSCSSIIESFLSKSDEEINIMSQNALNLIKKDFSWEEAAKRTIQVYNAAK